MTGQRIEVSRRIAAEPGSIFAVLRDPNGHVAIDASGMLMSSSGEAPGAVGDTFTIHMDREALNDMPLGEYDVTIVFTVYEPDREIAWTIDSPLLQPPIGHVYGYRLEPVDGGTEVTSFYDWSNIHEQWSGIEFPIIAESSLRATLGILARTVAPGKARPDAG